MKPSDYIKRGLCKNAYARDKDGANVEHSSRRAVRWCAMSAIYLAIKDPITNLLFVENLERLINIRRKKKIKISVYNDLLSTSQGDVVKKLEKIEEELGIE